MTLLFIANVDTDTVSIRRIEMVRTGEVGVQSGPNGEQEI